MPLYDYGSCCFVFFSFIYISICPMQVCAVLYGGCTSKEGEKKERGSAGSLWRGDYNTWCGISFREEKEPLKDTPLYAIQCIAFLCSYTVTGNCCQWRNRCVSLAKWLSSSAPFKNWCKMVSEEGSYSSWILMDRHWDFLCIVDFYGWTQQIQWGQSITQLQLCTITYSCVERPQK